MPTFPENLGELIRLKNLFGGEVPYGPGGTPTFSGQPYDLNNSPQPAHQAQDAFMGNINAMPERPEPGMVRKIFGNIAKIAGPGLSDEIMYGGYNRKLNDWKVKTNALGEAAGMENQLNSQNRLYESEKNRNVDRINDNTRGVHGLELREREIKRKEEADRIKSELMKNQGAKIRKDDKNGKEYLVYPDGRTIELPYEVLNFQDRMDLQREGKLEVLGVQAQNAQDLERVRQEGRETLEEAQARHRQELEKIRADLKQNDPAKAPTPNEIKQEKLNRIAQYVREHPEVEDRIEEDNMGNIRMKPKKVWPWQTSDPNDANVIQEFNDWVDKGIEPKRKGAVPSTPTKKAAPVKVGPKNTEVKAPDAPKGWKYVPKPGGGWTAVKEGSQ